MKTCIVACSIGNNYDTHSTKHTSVEFTFTNSYIDMFYKRYKCCYGHVTYMCIKCKTFILHKPSYSHVAGCFHGCYEGMYVITLPTKEYIRQDTRGGQIQGYISKKIYVSGLMKGMQYLICLMIDIMDPKIVNLVDEHDSQCDFDDIDYIDDGEDIYISIIDAILDKSAGCIFCGNVFDSFPTEEVISSHLVSPDCVSMYPLIPSYRKNILRNCAD